MIAIKLLMLCCEVARVDVVYIFGCEKSEIEELTLN